MSTAESVQPLLVQPRFALRRLHSLCGIVPIGLFLINHLLTNSTAFLGADRFNEHVHWIHSMPWLLGIEMVLIFIPLAFHGVYGVIIALEARYNPGRYPYLDNWRYTLQRISAYVLVAFVLVHLVHFRFAHWFGHEEYKLASPDFFTFTQQGFLSLWLPTWLWLAIYAVGTAAAVFHFCNGIVTFCITWGIVVGVTARRRLSILSAALGALLLAWGVVSLWALGRVIPSA